MICNIIAREFVTQSSGSSASDILRQTTLVTELRTRIFNGQCQSKLVCELADITHFHKCVMYFYISICTCSGVCRISFRGGVQKFSGKVGVFA